MKKMILTAAVAVLGFAMASAAEISMKFAPIKDPVTKTSTNTTIASDGVIIVDNKDGKSGGVSTHVNINQTAPAKIILSGESLCEESLTKSKNPHDYSLYIDLTYADGTKAYGKENPHREAYLELEERGEVRVVVATRLGQIIGFAFVLKTYHFHFSLPMATIETLWLDKAWRKSHAGLSLIRYCKAIARDWGYHHLTASAPAGSRLAQVYRRLATHTDDDFVFTV